VIASLNGVAPGAWVEHATLLEEAGADALELNVYYVSSSPGLAGSEIEWRYLDLVRSVRQTVGIPLAVKLSPYFSSTANMAPQLVEVGADGLVLFNRFYQPDLDLETLEVTPRLVLSTSDELRLPLRWIAILHGRLTLTGTVGRAWSDRLSTPGLAAELRSHRRADAYRPNGPVRVVHPSLGHEWLVP
jgi:dihydroorotate dehydrogenase (fumarate)